MPWPSPGVIGAPGGASERGGGAGGIPAPPSGGIGGAPAPASGGRGLGSGIGGGATPPVGSMVSGGACDVSGEIFIPIGGSGGAVIGPTGGCMPAFILSLPSPPPEPRPSVNQSSRPAIPVPLNVHRERTLDGLTVVNHHGPHRVGQC